MRTAANRDKNEPEIVDALKDMGAVVVKVNAAGLPDLCVGFKSVWIWMEVKSHPATQKAGRLRPSQEKFFEDAWAAGLPAYVVRSIADAIAAVNVETSSGEV